MLIIELSYRQYVVIVRCNKLEVFMINTRFSSSGPMDERQPFDTIPVVLNMRSTGTDDELIPK